MEGLKVKNRLGSRTKEAILTMVIKLKIPFLDTKWTDEEIEILKIYYPEEGVRVKDRLSRAKSSIITKATELNLKAPSKWTNEEIEILKKYYPQYGIDIKKLLPNRSIHSIKSQARRLNISSLKQRGFKSIFTDEENKIIKEYYPIEGNEVYKRLENKTKIQCKNRAAIMGVQKIEVN